MMSRIAFYEYLFAGEVLFRLPSDPVPAAPPRPEPASELPAREERVPEAAGERMAEVTASPFRRLKSRVLIMVNTYGKGIKPEEKEFLFKVLKAVKYNLEEVDLLELDKIENPDASEVMSGSLADYVLLFGVKPETLGLNIALNLYEPRHEQGIWFLMSNSLLRIEMEESKRRDLWGALKKMFFP